MMENRRLPNDPHVPGFDHKNGFYYNQQVKKLTLQFMAIFADMQVASSSYDHESEVKMIDVPIVYGRMDSVVANILSDNTRNKPFRLPLMVANIVNIAQALDRYSGSGIVSRTAHTPVGGMIPNDTRVTKHLRATPHNLDFELTIVTSNTDHQWQILEQLLLIFERPLQIQTSTKSLDPNIITSVTLTNINMENNWPIGTDMKRDVVVLSFSAIAYLAAPAEVVDELIRKINVRVGAVSTDTPLRGIADELDSQGIEYTTVHDSTDIENI